MTSRGHHAGLQTGKEFGQKEKEIHEQKKRDFSSANEELLGLNAETVYRDKSGKKVDMVNEYMKKQALEAGKKVKIESAQQDWRRGTTQKEEEIKARLELIELANEPFARKADDPKLEAWRKEQILDDDPMAVYFKKKQEKEQIKAQSAAGGQIVTKSSKPLYKGPIKPPNRFNILPGYRWDGVIRGVNWEERILNHVNEKVAMKEEAYKWSTSDM